MSTDSTRRRTAASTRSGWLMWMLCDRSPVASNVPRAACRSRREVALHDAALLAPRPAADHGQGHVTEMGAGQATVPPEGSAARGVVRAPLTPPSYQVPTGPRRRAGGVVGRLRRSLSLLPLARGDAMTWQETQGSLRRRPCATAPTSAWASSLVGRTPYQSDHEAPGSSRGAISRPAAAGPASSCTDSRPSIVLINRHAIARGVPHADRRTALPSATGGRRARRGPPGPAGARRGTRTSSARSAPRLPDVGTWWAPRFAGTASARSASTCWSCAPTITSARTPDRRGRPAGCFGQVWEDPKHLFVVTFQRAGMGNRPARQRRLHGGRRRPSG
jgi:hypothetical protein